jgi:hypothetical protein
MSEMGHRVFAAIANALDSDPNYRPAGVDLDKVARAAVTAMREPTPAMVRAAFDLANRDPLGSVSYAGLFRAMIDAALEE